MLEHSKRLRCILLLVPALYVTGATGQATELPEGYWTEDQVRAVLDKTLTLRFEPDLSGLSEPERTVVDRLLEVGEIFQRLHERTAYTGTGIGLAICRKIVDRHDGTITAKGTARSGAVFTITLPLRQRAETEDG